MASEGHDAPPTLTEITLAVRTEHDPSLLVEGLVMARLKETTSDFVFMDHEAKARAKMRFRYSLYGKFFGKPPLLDLVKLNLQAKWKSFSVVHISNLPNTYLLIHCEMNEAMQSIIFESPWSVNGITLQLVPWIRLHNLPRDF